MIKLQPKRVILRIHSYSSIDITCKAGTGPGAKMADLCLASYRKQQAVLKGLGFVLYVRDLS